MASDLQMNIWVPLPDFIKSAESLDDTMLGKQRLDIWQLLRTLDGFKGAWHGSQVAEMWADEMCALSTYGLFVCAEWKRRGNSNDTMYPRIHDYRDRLWKKGKHLPMPWWWADDEVGVHVSHQAALVQHMPEHYGEMFNWITPRPLIWATWEDV